MCSRSNCDEPATDKIYSHRFLSAGNTRHGRREFVLMSAVHYDWLTAAAKRRHRTADAAPVVIDAVERAEMDAGADWIA